MRKFLIALVLIIVANLGCKKEQIGDGICACSPATGPSVFLVLKNAAGADLLDTKIAGSFQASQIELTHLKADGSRVPVRFVIRPPFSYDGEKFQYHQLTSEELARLATSVNEKFYLKLGNGPTYEVNLNRDANTRVEKLLVNQVEVPSEAALKKYVDLFYITF
ncbi:MAG: hypothetical protein EOO90_04780 [Pedobacter sp.]|nr:MAG: hypothetical protein EOO90_04780 [Pedobacter sp.]